MFPFEKCPICGGELIEKKVEKLLRGGENTAVMKVKAEICSHCGERLYPQEIVRRFEKIRAQLKQKKTKGFQLLGRSFKVVSATN